MGRSIARSGAWSCAAVPYCTRRSTLCSSPMLDLSRRSIPPADWPYATHAGGRPIKVEHCWSNISPRLEVSGSEASMIFSGSGIESMMSAFENPRICPASSWKSGVELEIEIVPRFPKSHLGKFILLL